jgi:hypothetical protein
MDGVIFDVLPDGIPERTAWTAPHSKDAFLVLDRNGDGFINNGKELFGAATDQPRSAERNGFLALKLFDANGDQQIDSMDPIYKILRLWTDSNHNGTSEANELQSLRSVGVIEIGLSYHTTSRRDRHGNVLRFVSSVKMRAKKGIVSRQIYDVLLIGGSNTLPLFQ